MKKKVSIALSGGVDSSVAAALLLEEGYEVTALFMQLHDLGSYMPDKTEHPRYSCFGSNTQDSFNEAARVCDILGIKLFKIYLINEFKNYVIEYFKKEYKCGKTPNPCVVCNRTIKFGLFIEKAKASGIDFDMFATGHYARISRKGEHFLLKKGKDPSKDQSYFLYTLTSDQLSRTMFPIGSYTKEQIRIMAKSIGLANAGRKDSQDFIGKGGYSSIFDKDKIRPGKIVDKKGNILGTHRGIIHYTIGQRKGLGISSGTPLYIIRIDAKGNRIVVGEQKDLLSKELIAKDVNLIAINCLKKPVKVTAKIRYQHKEARAVITPVGNRIKVVFDEPQSAITPGQAVVFYQDETVIGGGTIV